METQVEQMKIEARRKLIEQVVGHHDGHDDHDDHEDYGDDDDRRKVIELVDGHGRGDHEHCGGFKGSDGKDEDDDGDEVTHIFAKVDRGYARIEILKEGHEVEMEPLTRDIDRLQVLDK